MFDFLARKHLSKTTASYADQCLDRAETALTKAYDGNFRVSVLLLGARDYIENGDIYRAKDEINSALSIICHD